MASHGTFDSHNPKASLTIWFCCSRTSHGGFPTKPCRTRYLVRNLDPAVVSPTSILITLSTLRSGLGLPRYFTSSLGLGLPSPVVGSTPCGLAALNQVQSIYSDASLEHGIADFVLANLSASSFSPGLFAPGARTLRRHQICATHVCAHVCVCTRRRVAQVHDPSPS
mmetsp:Transcript_27226/g.82663  ORF Transcript_27226/g.82663 Transcript_27226/m.82663 type:complete len:167 (-) Transcript_27226:43-543(-)